MNETIEMNAPTKAFYAGVAAGSDASDTVPSDQPFEIRLSFFWLSVGAKMADEKIDAEHHHRFIEGATLRKPQRENEFVLELDLTAASVPEDVEDMAFEEHIRPWVVQRLIDLARRELIEWTDEPVWHENKRVGTYRIF